MSTDDTLPTYGRALCRAVARELIAGDALARLLLVCPVCDLMTDTTVCPRCHVERLPRPTGTIRDLLTEDTTDHPAIATSIT